MEKAGGTYFTSFGIIPGDGRWHTRLIPLADFSSLPGSPTDPNGRLDADQVSKISIGLNSEAPDNAIEVSDLYSL